MRAEIGAGFLAAILIASPAFADWQYTKWGMSADEIVAASGGAGHLVPSGQIADRSGEDFTAIALGTFSTGPFRFDVSFRARKDSGRLHQVRLELKDPSQYEDLMNSLSAKYGTGEVTQEDSSVASLSKIRWRAKPDTVVLLRVQFPITKSDNVFLDYIETVSNADL